MWVCHGGHAAGGSVVPVGNPPGSKGYARMSVSDVVYAAYARRGWDDDGVPTLETVQVEGIDFPEVLDLIAKHAHRA